MTRNRKRAAKIDQPAGAPQARSTAKQRVAEMRQEEARKARQRTVMRQVVIGTVIAGTVLGLTIAVLGLRDDSTVSGGDVSGPEVTPAQVTDDGSFTVGNPDAPVTVQVVEDFQCPVCQQFESIAGDLLDGYAEGDDVKVEYRGIAFLDRMSSTDYSSRALNASACVMGEGEDVWRQFHRQLFLQQPPEGGEGLPDSELADIAVDAGADRDGVTSCIEDGTYRVWAANTTDASGADGITGTPTVFVDGKLLDGFDPADIEDAVDEALGR
jgi:protein-disulfide isomerase